jgi:tRNA A-37 threonylcarbamoyl transferase component Bud32
MDAAMRALFDEFARSKWPEGPPGFAALTPPRPMRVVLRGRILGPRKPVDVVVKWSRPVTLADRVSRLLRGGKGAREGLVLRALLVAGVEAPEPVGWTDEGVDLLVVRTIEELHPLVLVTGVARLLARAHAAGLVHRDLTRENLALARSMPVLLDVGGARLAPGRADIVRTLAQARHALLGDVSQTRRRRALVRFLEEIGRDDARALARPVEELAARLAIRYRRGRDRRAMRDGKHFALLRARGLRGVLFRDAAPPGWDATQGRRLLAGDPPGATSVLPGSRARRMRIDGADVVVRRFRPVAPGRVPRAVRWFRAAVALSHRMLETPAPVLAASAPGQGSVLVTRWADAERIEAHASDERLLTRLGRTLRRLHDAGLSHRDLKPSNLLARQDHDGWHVLFADLEGVRVRRRPPSWRRRARELGRLDAGLPVSEAGRERWLSAYLDVMPWLPCPREEFLRRVAARAAWKRRRKAAEVAEGRSRGPG